MALLYWEGFDYYSSSTDMNRSEESRSGGAPQHLSLVSGFPAGLSGQGQALSFGSFGTDNYFITPGAGVSNGGQFRKLHMGYRFKYNSAIASQNVVHFHDGTSIQCGLSFNASSKLIAWRGTAATVLGTGTQTFLTGATYFIEITVDIDNSGSFLVKIDGTTEINTGTVDTSNTANSWCSQIRFLGSLNKGLVIDDLYINDTAGSAPHNALLGIIMIETSFPNANSTPVAFTPSASSNFTNVNEITDNDTTYNSSIADTGVPRIDMFTHTALSNNPVTIFAVAVDAAARKDDTTLQKFKVRMKSDDSLSETAAYTDITTVYRHWKVEYLTDTDTGILGTAWSKTTADATVIGYEHAS